MLTSALLFQFQFQHVPLYLEWAPMNVFNTPPAGKKAELVNEDKEEKGEKTENKCAGFVFLTALKWKM